MVIGDRSGSSEFKNVSVASVSRCITLLSTQKQSSFLNILDGKLHAK
jgi:hypothetical protein